MASLEINDNGRCITGVGVDIEKTLLMYCPDDGEWCEARINVKKDGDVLIIGHLSMWQVE